MTSRAASHATTVALSERVPDAVPAGSKLSVTIQVACAEGCDLRGLPLTLIEPDGTASSHALATHGTPINATGEIKLHVPAEVGPQVWRVRVAGHVHGSAAKHDGMFEFAITIVAHTTSLAVWSIPDAVAVGERFTVTAGVKSSGSHDLSGQTIEVCDDGGTVAGRAVLAPMPWQGTSALYWAEVLLIAPGEPGISTWSARFAASACAQPHEPATTAFTVAVVAKPEHRLTVDVTDKVTSAPIDNAIVRAGGFRGATDAQGRAELKVAKGSYEIVVWKVGFEAPSLTIEMMADQQIRVEVAPVPEEDPDARWLG